MAESKIIIQVLLDDKASDPLKKVESGLSGVNKETEKFNEHEKERERLQQRIIKATSKENIELKQLELRLQMANKRATETAKARINAAEGQDMFAKSVSKTTGALKGNRAQSGLNNAILIELGRTASDAQYGFQGMANNIGRLVELGQEFARTGGGGLKAALGTLGKSILGGGGILIAIQLLISFLPTIQKKFKNWRDGVKGVTEAHKELTKTLDDLIKLGEDNNKELLKQEKLLSKAGNELLRLGRLYKEESTNKSKSRDKQGEYNSQIEKSIKVFEQYGIQVDKTKLKDNDYIKSLVDKGQTVEKLANEIYGLQTELEVGRALGEISPLEEAEKELQIFIKTQELAGVEKDKYVKSTQYKVLVAKRTKAENEARLAVLREEFAEQYKQELELKEVIKRMVAESQDEEVPIFGDAEVLDMSLSQYSDFISKYIDRTLEGLDEQEKKALEELDGFYIDALLTEEEYQKGKTAIQEFYSNKRITQEEKEKRIKIKAIKAKEEVEMAYANTLSNLGNFLSLLGEKNKGLAIAGVVAEQAANVAKIISNTMAANAIAKVMSPLTLGQPFIKLNNVSAALGIATSVLSARNAIKQINSGQLSSSTTSTSGGGGGSAPSIQAPDFNVVGASGQSQLAQTIAGTEARPVRAFVVGKDVSTQQEMDRNITNTASFG